MHSPKIVELKIYLFDSAELAHLKHLNQLLCHFPCYLVSVKIEKDIGHRNLKTLINIGILLPKI